MADEMEQENGKRPLAAEETGPTIEETAKRARLDPDIQPETAPQSKPSTNVEPQTTFTHQRPNNGSAPEAVSRLGLKPALPIMPPSLELVTGVKADLRARKGFVGQEEVGIIGYAGDPAFKGVKGVIKQRFTDFLVNEVGLDGEVLRLKQIGKPTDPYDTPRDKSKGKGKGKADDPVAAATPAPTESTAEDAKPADDKAEPETQDDLPEKLRFEPLPLWKSETTRALLPVFSEPTIAALHALLVEGKDPPPKSDGGWGSRKARIDAAAGSEEAMMNVEEGGLNAASTVIQGGRGGSRGQGRDRGRGRGGRGGRGGGRGGESEQWWAGRGDDREVLSQSMSRDERTKAHQTIRELFSGTFETAARDVAGEEGQRISITWSRHGGQARRVDKRKAEESDKPRPPPYIHFTLHKTNRDTQDCITHLSRALGCQANDLSVCGTKDKRAVTVQRVCFKRRGKNLLAVWKSANNIRPGRNTEAHAVQERGDRGARIGDLEYSDKYLELGMLRGNHFAITLRSVQSEASREEIDAYLTGVRSRGFVNYYGMQRFGTSTVPTHVTGLFILQSKWAEAVDSILSLREGEHPDCVRGRLAWLEDEDLDKALELMPRRCVAERSIWQHWKKTGPKDKLGALGSIPRNLRTMYVHAYQSYIWNLVVTERIKLSATEPLVGDLVFDGDADADAEEDKVEEEDSNANKNWKPSHETSSSQEVKQLTTEDLPNHTIHDVIMPLPGWNIEYPAGDIGELYGKILKADDLDAHKMRREQREYSLPGSYRKMIHLPSRFAWSHVSYTDPDVSLVQSDEDQIIGQNPPAEHDPEGKFQALKIELTLGPSAYATMAIREITREETSTWHQIGLTAKGEDQGFKGTSGPDAVATAAVGGEEEQANATS